MDYSFRPIFCRFFVDISPISSVIVKIPLRSYQNSMTAPHTAGVIKSTFEEGFIQVEMLVPEPRFNLQSPINS